MSQTIEGVIEEFREFLDKQTIPEDFSDWNDEDWQIFALEYLKANWDEAMEGAFEEQEWKDVSLPDVDEDPNHHALPEDKQ